MSKKTNDSHQGCSKHKLIQEGCIDCWCPPSKPPVMQPPCTCCQEHKIEIEKRFDSIEKFLRKRIGGFY